MKVFGELKPSVADSLHSIVTRTSGLRVSRDGKARSSTPFPKSTDLELALKPLLLADGFQHHVSLQHPRLEVGFEYDFWLECLIMFCKNWSVGTTDPDPVPEQVV